MSALSTDRLIVKTHPREDLLTVLVVLASILIWIMLTASIIGLIYALILGVFFWFVHLTFITHIRGSTIRLGPEQLPELYKRVEILSERIGLKQVPAVYLMESGTLNAFATRFMRSNFIVLYSDLVEACGDNADALDFIIAHELGHIHRGHLRWHLFKTPGMFVPFLGQAYSRSRELTCDRYGLAACTDKAKGVEGLCILAAGPRYAPRVDKRVFTDQCADLKGFWMTLGRLLSSYPPLAVRLALLSSNFADKAKQSSAMATLIILLVVLGFGGVGALGVGAAVNKIKADIAKVTAHQQSQQASPYGDEADDETQTLPLPEAPVDPEIDQPAE